MPTNRLKRPNACHPGPRSPRQVVTTHYMQMFWRKEWAPSYGKNTTTLMELWPKVTAPRGFRPPRPQPICLPSSPPDA